MTGCGSGFGFGFQGLGLAWKIEDPGLGVLRLVFEGLKVSGVQEFRISGF